MRSALISTRTLIQRSSSFTHSSSRIIQKSSIVLSSTASQSHQSKQYQYIKQKNNYVTSTKTSLLPVQVINVPTMGDSITEGTIVDIPVGPGDYVEADDVVIVLETDKVSVDVRANESGKIVDILGEVDQVMEVGSGLYKIDTDDVGEASNKKDAKKEEDVVETQAVVDAPPTPVATPPPPKASKPSPTPAAPAAAPQSALKPKMITSVEKFRSERRAKLSRMRQRVATRLKEAQNTAAMLTTFQEVDMSAIMEMRAKYKDEFLKKHGVKLGFMSAFVKASTASLQEIPAVNAYIDDATKEIVYRDYVDISVAVASPNGLVVPVLRNTEFMSFADVEKTIGLYGQKAKDGALGLEEMAGGTFTISNGGVFGSLMGTPIINPPQSAILGMHATKMRPVVVDGQVLARPMMYLALTYDHRLIDGREGVTFLKSIADKVADPSRLLLEL